MKGPSLFPFLPFRKAKPRFEKPRDLDDLPPPEAASNLPPVILQGSKGFNLQSSLQNDNNNSRTEPGKPLGRVRLAPLEKHWHARVFST